MTTRIIEIDGMSGDTCVHEVKHALGGLEGVEVASVTVGTAVLDCDDDAACLSACRAIDSAGFTSSELDITPSRREPHLISSAGAKPEPGAPPKGPVLPDERDLVPDNGPAIDPAKLGRAAGPIASGRLAGLSDDAK